ncbi:putative reverse transcriptase, RNA-dependent DNA polymerase [Helianthus anomalus]
MMCEAFKRSMQNEFEMTDLGLMKYFLGVEVRQDSRGITLCQAKYAREVLERFQMWNSNDVQVPIVPGTLLNKEGLGEDCDSTLYKRLTERRSYGGCKKDFEICKRNIQVRLNLFEISR